MRREIGPAFDLGLWACHCGCKGHEVWPARLELVYDRVRTIQRVLREQGYTKVTLELLSGYRCQAHNRKVGGARNSKHMLGQAADLRPVGCSVVALCVAARVVRGEQGGGIGLYARFVHVDVRKAKANWWGR